MNKFQSDDMGKRVAVSKHLEGDFHGEIIHVTDTVITVLPDGKSEFGDGVDVAEELAEFTDSAPPECPSATA